MASTKNDIVILIGQSEYLSIYGTYLQSVDIIMIFVLKLVVVSDCYRGLWAIVNDTREMRGGKWEVNLKLHGRFKVYITDFLWQLKKGIHTHTFGKKNHKKKMKVRGAMFESFIANLNFIHNQISNHHTNGHILYTKFFWRTFVDKEQSSLEEYNLDIYITWCTYITWWGLCIHHIKNEVLFLDITLDNINMEVWHVSRI